MLALYLIVGKTLSVIGPRRFVDVIHIYPSRAVGSGWAVSSLDQQETVSQRCAICIAFELERCC